MEKEAIGLLIQFALKYGIPAAIEVAGLFQKKEATIEDVTAAFGRAHKKYEDFENLPLGSTVPPLPPA